MADADHFGLPHIDPINGGRQDPLPFVARKHGLARLMDGGDGIGQDYRFAHRYRSSPQIACMITAGRSVRSFA